MSFKSLNHILGALEEQARWQEQPFQRLLKCWPDVVGAAVTAQTQPVSIQRGILSVATSSAAWAQTLTFERQRILEKLNVHLPSPLVDIRFSTAQWQRPKDSSLEAGNQATTDLWREHPSSLVNAPRVPKISETPNSNNPNAAFGHWAKVMQARAHGLPLCPQCHCPTPAGELQRWAICSICAARQW
jgi:predicted nucleic acid-binding Zn ribbon protein